MSTLWTGSLSTGSKKRKQAAFARSFVHTHYVCVWDWKLSRPICCFSINKTWPAHAVGSRCRCAEVVVRGVNHHVTLGTGNRRPHLCCECWKKPVGCRIAWASHYVQLRPADEDCAHRFKLIERKNNISVPLWFCGPDSIFCSWDELTSVWTFPSGLAQVRINLPSTHSTDARSLSRFAFPRKTLVVYSQSADLKRKS